MNLKHYQKGLLLLLFCQITLPVFSQGLFITPSSKTICQLSLSQTAVFNQIDAEEDEYTGHTMINLEAFSQVHQNGTLLIEIPGITCGLLAFSTIEIHHFADDDYWYYGIIESETPDSSCSIGTIAILINDEGLFGTLSIDETDYEIRDLTEGQYIIFEVDGTYEDIIYALIRRVEVPVFRFRKKTSTIKKAGVKK